MVKTKITIMLIHKIQKTCITQLYNIFHINIKDHFVFCLLSINRDQNFIVSFKTSILCSHAVTILSHGFKVSDYQ